MGKIEITLPAMGEGIIEATITRWFVKEGDFVYEDDPLLEVATDKVDSEIPSPFEGTISQIFYREGEIPRVGAVLALIESDSSGDSDEVATSEQKEQTVISKEPPKCSSRSRMLNKPNLALPAAAATPRPVR